MYIGCRIHEYFFKGTKVSYTAKEMGELNGLIFGYVCDHYLN
ncbi:MAG: hypothetical protein H6R34_248 [Bacteroidetes bacterium]|nr:hypothetical protein [Bacteroidota bacterium]